MSRRSSIIPKLENRWDTNFFLSLGKIRHFFAKSDENKREYDLNTYFLEIIDNIFRGVYIEFSFLNDFFMKKIRRDFLDYDSKGKERFNFRSSIKNALMSIIFFENLGLITFAEMNELKESKFEEVFKKYGNTFNLPVKRGLFLAGTLTEMLLRKQSIERGAKPFMNKLNVNSGVKFPKFSGLIFPTPL